MEVDPEPLHLSIPSPLLKLSSPEEVPRAPHGALRILEEEDVR